MKVINYGEKMKDKKLPENYGVFCDEHYSLGMKDGKPYFTADGKYYELSCQPYEPCLHIKDEGGTIAYIHNAFDPYYVIEAFYLGNTVEAITGKIYGPKEFCEMLAYAAGYLSDTDISYVEGAVAVEKLKALGANCPQNAVFCAELGVRAISDRFSHSKKREERVMYTEDGKVYVRIKNR